MLQPINVQNTGAIPASPDVAVANGAIPGAVQLSWTQAIMAQLKAQTATVTVRPYYWAGGAWHPLGADGASPSLPITADPTQYGGMAEGKYDSPGFGAYWILYLETGALANVVSAAIGEVPAATST